MPEIDFDRALRALDGNTELLRDLAVMFVEDTPILFEKLRLAVTDRHPKQAGAIVHSLKGLIATFFAKTGVDVAQRLEESFTSGELDLLNSSEIDRLEDFTSLLTLEFESLGWTVERQS